MRESVAEHHSAYDTVLDTRYSTGVAAMTFLRSALLTKGGTRSALLFCALFGWSIPAEAEYRIDAGDILEIAVAGMPDWRQRIEVQLDGSISYPLLGTLVVAGLSPSEVRTKIQGIPTKV